MTTGQLPLWTVGRDQEPDHPPRTNPDSQAPADEFAPKSWRRGRRRVHTIDPQGDLL